jgi:hypothetical protein
MTELYGVRKGWWDHPDRTETGIYREGVMAGFSFPFFFSAFD